MTRFHRLRPADPALPHELLASFRPRERTPERRPFVYLNMVSSADGRATIAGRTRALGSAADTLLLTELRALADAVLIGTGTIRAEGYGRLVSNPARIARRTEAGLAGTPTAVVISRGLDVPWDAGLFAAADQPVLVYSGRAGAPPPDVAAAVRVIALPDPSPAAVLADLRARGVRALLCEGGPTLNRALLASDLVDELFLTLAPLLTGDDQAPRIVTGAALATPARLALAWALQHEDELYLRYEVRR